MRDCWETGRCARADGLVGMQEEERGLGEAEVGQGLGDSLADRPGMIPFHLRCKAVGQRQATPFGFTPRGGAGRWFPAEPGQASG